MKLIIYLFFCINLVLFSETSKENLKIIGTVHIKDEKKLDKMMMFFEEEIKSYRPDIIAIELREQDINENNEYLKNYYPLELIGLKEKYENIIKIHGFDWRGANMENKRIEYWRINTPQLKKHLFNNPKLKKLVSKRKNFLLSLINSKTLKELQNLSKKNITILADINKIIDEELIKNRLFELTDYYKDRHKHMINNIKNLQYRYPDKKIMVITGFFHLEKLKESL